MSVSETKIELARQILNTNNKELINYLKAIFSGQPKNWWEELPDEIKASVDRGLKQAANKQTLPHSQVMKKYSKWLKK
jgi:hypothetical protein